jgi:hypothetical protein
MVGGLCGVPREDIGTLEDYDVVFYVQTKMKKVANEATIARWTVYYFIFYV